MVVKNCGSATDGIEQQIGRRKFMASAGAAAMSFTIIKPTLVRGTEANSKIRLGIIGCGMRGKWIADIFVKHGGYKIVATADYFRESAVELGEKHGVARANCYAKLSGYRRLLDQKLDAVAIESPPYFHPEQAAAAVEAGVHVICAKPIAVDVPGCNTISKASQKATSKKLCFFVDFQTRANNFYCEAVKRVHYGDIGRIGFGEACFNGGDVWNSWIPVEHFLEANPNNPEARLKA